MEVGFPIRRARDSSSLSIIKEEVLRAKVDLEGTWNDDDSE